MDETHRQISIEHNMDINPQGYAEERYTPTNQMDSSHYGSTRLSSLRPQQTQRPSNASDTASRRFRSQSLGGVAQPLFYAGHHIPADHQLGPQDYQYASDGSELVRVPQQETSCQPDSTCNSREVFHIPSHKALAEECGWQIGRDKFLSDDEMHNTQLVITERGFLGKGVVGIVEEVQVEGFEKTFARKRIMLSKGRQAAIRDRIDIQSEIENLKSLDHENIVKVLGCYEERWGRTPTICVLMYPVGDADLGHFLYEQCQPASEQQKLWIRSWFLCLASALAYMHAQGVHHEDIKPGNIVHRGDTIFFTDFSSSRRIEAGQDTSTESLAKASRLFAAPEAMSDDGKVLRHGSKSDIFSLGLVYVEMLVVLEGRSVYEMRETAFKDNTQGKRYCHVIDKLPCDVPDGMLPAIFTLSTMLYPARKFRPSADTIVEYLSDGDWKQENEHQAGSGESVSSEWKTESDSEIGDPGSQEHNSGGEEGDPDDEEDDHTSEEDSTESQENDYWEYIHEEIAPNNDYALAIRRAMAENLERP